MSELISTKPYMIRALHEWCVDNNLTPHLLVAVNPQTRVPKAFVKDGEIVLNLNYSATKDLHMDNEAIVFSARFSGVSQNIYVPMNAVKGIFARENGQGMFFEIDTKAVEIASSESVSSDGVQKSAKKKPTLTIVK
ncbi:MAG: ClpXP protease specificity-enhancing factor [Pseudomonadota bacterium]